MAELVASYIIYYTEADKSNPINTFEAYNIQKPH